MARGITRTGNPFHRVPLLFTTRDSQGKLVSFMPGGPRILEARKQDVVVCMTLDAENNEIPIPFMGGDIGVVEDESGLSENPPDGLIAIVEKAELRTEGRRKFFPLDEVPAVFFPFEQSLDQIKGFSSISFSNCTFGTHIGGLDVLFIEDIEGFDMGLSGPAMLISTGDEEHMELVYICIAQAGLLEGFSEAAIAVDAGWNKLVKTTNIWRKTPVAASAIPVITDVTVEEFEVDTLASPFASDAEWVWITGLAYSLGGEWHGELKPQLPEFIAYFPEDDIEEEHLAAHTHNMYSRGRYNNGECKEPDMRDNVAMLSGWINANGYMSVNIPAATLHTTAAVKAPLESRLSALLASGFGEGLAITLDEFEYRDGSPVEGQTAYGYWYGRVVWHDLLTQQVVREPYLHNGVRVEFRNEGGH